MSEVCDDDTLWKRLYKQRWGSEMAVTGKSITGKKDFQQRHRAEARPWHKARKLPPAPDATYTFSLLVKQRADPPKPQWVHTDGRKRSRKPHWRAIGRWRWTLVPMQQEIDAYWASGDGLLYNERDEDGAFRFFFQGSHTVTFQNSDKKPPPFDIPNTVEPWAIREGDEAEDLEAFNKGVVFNTDSAHDFNCLRATLFIHRHADGAAACVWHDIRLSDFPDDYEETLQFGGLWDEGSSASLHWDYGDYGVNQDGVRYVDGVSVSDPSDCGVDCDRPVFHITAVVTEPETKPTEWPPAAVHMSLGLGIQRYDTCEDLDLTGSSLLTLLAYECRQFDWLPQ